MPILSKLKDIFNPSGDSMDKPYKRISFGSNKVDIPKPTEVNPIRAASQKLMDLMSEPDEAQDKYDQYLAAQPTEDQYKPSKKRRLGAALAGFGIGLTNPIAGAKIGKDIADEPFNKAVSNWTRTGKPIALAAGQEQKNKTTRINLLKDYISGEHQANVEDYTAHNIAADNLRADLAAARTEEERQRVQARYDESEKRLTDTATQAHNDRMTANDRALATLEESKKQHTWERSHGDTMATVAQQNAATNQNRVSTYATSVAGVNAYRDYLIGKTAKASKPTKQTKELAEINTIMKPGNSQKYSDFYHQDEHGKLIIEIPRDPDTDTLLQWAAFQKEIENEHNKIVAPNQSTVPAKDNKPKSNFTVRPVTPPSR